MTTHNCFAVIKQITGFCGERVSVLLAFRLGAASSQPLVDKDSSPDEYARIAESPPQAERQSPEETSPTNKPSTSPPNTTTPRSTTAWSITV